MTSARRFIGISLSALVLACLSCSKAGLEPSWPESISVDAASTVYPGDENASFIEFSLNPGSYDLMSEKATVSLEVVESNISSFQGKSPIYYTLGSLEAVKGSAGKYRIGIKDLNKGVKYVDKVRLVVKFITSEGTKSIASEPFDVSYSSNEIIRLAFMKKHNPTAIHEDFEIDLSSSSAMIVSPFITSSELVLSFTTDAVKVLAADKEQVSGETVNDFSQPVTYSFVSASGNIRRFTIQVKCSGLPVVVIQTPGAAEIPPKTEDWLGETTVTIYDTECNVTYSGQTGIRGRGNSTWKYPKKPYALKLDKKAEILGMPAHKRWVLLANWLDRTLLRNHVSFRIAMQTGLAWTPRGEFVEVILNGNHIGNYYLCEHIKVDKNRVNIHEPEDGDIDGGFLMELDTYYDEAFKFKSAIKKFPFMFKDPDEVNDGQFAYMQDYINTLEASLYDSARLSAREYADYLDIDSFIDWWITYELTGNTETHHPKSSYMYKDKGGKLMAGPVWDFDWKTFRLNNEEWVTKNHLYYDVLFNDPVFVARVKERWNMHEAKLREILAFIESEAARIRVSESINHQMWPVTQNTNDDINLTFSEAVSRMKASYEAKLEFMDKEIAAM